jgi:hypothetical protein
MRAAGRSGPDQQRAPSRQVGVARVNLLPRYAEMFVLLHGSGAQRRQVAAGVRFGEPLAPVLIAVEEFGQAFGGPVGRILDQHGGQHLGDLVGFGQHITGPVHFLINDRAQRQRTAQAADLVRPSPPSPAVVVEDALKAAFMLEYVCQRARRQRGERSQFLRMVGQPSPQRLAQFGR